MLLVSSLTFHVSFTFRAFADRASFSLSLSFAEVALQVFAHKLGHGKPHLVKPKATNHGGQAKLKRMESRNSSSSARKVEMAGHYE
jgi:hypothetical protein